MEFGVNKTPEYLAINPNGLVPSIDDAGHLLWESQAVMRYLVRKSKTQANKDSLYPADPLAASMVDQWLEWNSTTVWPAMRPLFWGWVRLKENERDPIALEQNRLQMIKNFEILNQRLKITKFVAGDYFTLADIPLALIAYRWFNIPIERTDFEHINRWYLEVCNRPGFKKYCSSPLT
jgi:glutathione S-transferase